jgi:chromosome segregation ATPase
MTATYSGLVGFIRLACFVLVRRVKLTQMKATLLRLQKDRQDAYVALGRRALEMKLSNAEIAALASQLEALDPEVAALRDQIRAVEGVPLPDDPDIRKAELNLRKVKTGKLNEAIQATEAKAQPIFGEMGHIVHREKMEPQALEPYYGRIQGVEAEIAAQERRISDTEEEYEAVSSGTRALAYGFWVAVVVIILAILFFATRGGSSAAKKTALGPIPSPPAESERLG